MILSFPTSNAVVSLFVRLWVEISFLLCVHRFLSSASSWGCELKSVSVRLYKRKPAGQPLREAVSWNVSPVYVFSVEPVSLFVRLWVEITLDSKYRLKNTVSLFVRLWVEMQINVTEYMIISSASSWGCELKWLLRYLSLSYFPSASSWGCELKFFLHHPACRNYSVSLFVRLWVEIMVWH